ncbi:MAG TPA: adenylate/guanylate cyclase domain-containing protein [Solirubrobacteraceae bacterium]
MQIETRYARNDGATIAWTSAGDAPTDLLFIPGFISHVEHLWEQPGLAGFFERLTGFTRFIVMDRRGCGLSDSRPEELGLDDEVADVLAVLDAAGSERAVLMGYTTGGLLAITVAARAPERVQALVLYASMARAVADDEVDWTLDEVERRALWARLADAWGTGTNLEQIAPSRKDDPRMRAWMARMERLSSSPGELLKLMNYVGGHNVSHLLGELRVPTLIVHRTGDRLIDVRHSRYLAERIPGARFVELEGADNLPGAVDSSDLLGEIEEFLTGGRSRTVARELLTVIFSDIADSTGHAARLGDGEWRDLLAAHQVAVRREIDRFGGREVKTIGDAFLIAFDGAPSHAVRCADAIVQAVREVGLEVRVGLHTGECEVIGGDVGGMAVHIAARVAAVAQPGEVMASGTTYGTVVGAGLRFADRGMQELKGVPGRWPLFALQAV